jgi:membrane protease YdiL (CAAX protease family)
MTLAGRRSATSIRTTIAEHPISAFVVIAFASSWAMTGLLSVSLLFGLVALFGPTAGAIIVSWAEGSLVELRDRVTTWRLSPRMLLIAVGLPLLVTGTAAVLWTVAGHDAPGIGSVSAIELLIFVLVIGEEIGWRGFLLPRLRGHLSLPAAGIATGVIWTLWHVPIYLQAGQGLAAFAVFAWWVLPVAVVMAFVVERARFSVLVATIMHGAANVSIPLLLPGVDLTWTLAATGTLYGLFAGALVIHSHVTSRQSAAARFHSKEVAA